jgi:hypothetical protein
LPVTPPYRAYLPVAVDLGGRMPPVGNQQNSATAAAWAAAYAARGFYTASLEGRDIREPANLASPGYVYHLARQGGCDDGTSIVRVVDVLRHGALSLADYPFKPDCVSPPDRSAVAAAHDFRVLGMHRVDLRRIDDLKGELTQSNPVVVELQASPAFKRLRGDPTFSEPDFAAGNKDNGWHFVTLVGFDERRQAFRLINSWGPGWGDHGYAWLGYDAFKLRTTHAYVLDVAAPRRPKSPSDPADASKGQPAKPDLSDLDRLACAHVRVETDSDRHVLSGHVASETDLRLVAQIAANVPGTTLRDVEVVAWPFCEALETLQAPLASADPPKISLGAGEPLHDGDNLAIEVRSPKQPAYLYVAYIQADGSIINLAQPKGATDGPTAPGATLKFGDGQEGRPRFLISRPFGREMILAIASRSRLVADPLPTRQSARDYLSALRRSLIAERPGEQPGLEVSAAIRSLKTQSR